MKRKAVIEKEKIYIIAEIQRERSCMKFTKSIGAFGKSYAPMFYP